MGIRETTPQPPSGPLHFGTRSALGMSEIEQDCRREENRGVFVVPVVAIAAVMAFGLIWYAIESLITGAPQ